MGSIGSRATENRISGDVSFSEMMNVQEKFSDGSINFGKGITVLPSRYIPESGLKRDLESLLNKYNMNEVVINMYRDRAGANDLQRMKDLGFEIVAQYRGEPIPDSKIPPKDYYYMRRKKR